MAVVSVINGDRFTNEWFQYEPIELPATRRTRQCKRTYQTKTPCPPPSMISSFLYTTMNPIPHSDLYHITGPALLLPSSLPPQPTLWDTTVAPIWSDTPIFYQRAIGPKPPTTSQCNNIAEAIQNEALMLCSDDANDRSLEVGSQGWVFGGKIETILATGSGPTDGDPSTMSLYTSSQG